MTLVGGTTTARVLDRVGDQVQTGGAWRWGALGAGAAAGAALAWTAAPGIADDGYITLSIARNVAEHGCWCVTPGLESNTATSPLWVLLLAAPMLLAGPVAALGAWLTVLTAGTSLAVAALARRCSGSWLAGPLAAAGLVVSPVLQAAVGLESTLAVFLLAVLAWAAAADRVGLGGVVVGLLALTRPDLAVVGLVAVVWWRRSVPTLLAAAAATVAPWLAASLVMFGSLVPDTLVWKQGAPGLGYTSLLTAPPLFLAHWPAATTLTLATLAIGGLLAVAWAWHFPWHPITFLAAAGGLHLATMIGLRVGSFVWYVAPAVGVAVIGLALAAVTLPRTVGPIAAVLFLAGLTLTIGHDWRTQGPPFGANGATSSQYAALAARVPTGATIETAHGEVGSIAFFCGQRCRVVDPLSDPGRLAPLIEARLSRSTLLPVLYPSWHPQAPAPATWQTRYARGESGAFPVFSSYSGWSAIAVEPIR